MNHDFFCLTPDAVLDAVEQSGHHTTGMCYALNSLENRVYEVELDDRTRVVGKFYRPKRWTEEAIRAEHKVLDALCGEEVPVCAPLRFAGNETLHRTSSGIFFSLFPRVGGRSPDDLRPDQFEQLGRLIARIHNIAAPLGAAGRPVLTPQSYGVDYLAIILERVSLAPGIRQRYTDAVTRIVQLGITLFAEHETTVLHGDCHRGNLLYGREGFFFLDFDDMLVGPPVQDLWLLLPARPKDCPRELEALIKGYDVFRAFDHRSLRLIELLRALRYVRYAGWIAERWEDPSFQRVFPEFHSDRYWEAQYADLCEQLGLIEQ